MTLKIGTTKPTPALFHEAFSVAFRPLFHVKCSRGSCPPFKKQMKGVVHPATPCNKLHHTATHCNTLQHTVPPCQTLQHTANHCNTLWIKLTPLSSDSESAAVYVAVCCSVLQCVVVCCSVLHCVAECCSVLQCVAVCCSVLQCVAVCCNMLQCVHQEITLVYICRLILNDT